MIKRFLLKYSLIFFCFFIITCVRRITPPIRESAPILVVEGLLTTDSTPYTVKLSYTGKFLNASARIDSNQNYINDARVVIKDDAGDSTLCNLISPGTYQSIDSGFVGIVSHTYTLEVYLSNGKVYVSTPEKITPVPAIDSISIVYDSTYNYDTRPTQLIISANVHDPADTQNFYRWASLGWVPRKAWGNPCGYGSPSPTNPFVNACGALCLQYQGYNSLNVLSDQFVNGQEIIQPVFYSPVYWLGKHYIQVQQMSLNKDLYLFWQQYLQQTNRTGSILDPLPSSLIGNIHNQSDSNDVALGYFQTSAIITKKIIIIPHSIQLYILESTAAQYIPMGDCHGSIPNTLDDDAMPPGWENAEIIDFY